MKSTFLSLNAKDFLKGLVLSVLSAVITVLYTSIEKESLVFDFKSIGMVALSTALGYIVKNLLTNSKDQFLKDEPKV
jgi:hypothetical protein